MYAVYACKSLFGWIHSWHPLAPLRAPPQALDRPVRRAREQGLAPAPESQRRYHRSLSPLEAPVAWRFVSLNIFLDVKGNKLRVSWSMLILISTDTYTESVRVSCFSCLGIPKKNTFDFGCLSTWEETRKSRWLSGKSDFCADSLNSLGTLRAFDEKHCHALARYEKWVCGVILWFDATFGKCLFKVRA